MSATYEQAMDEIMTIFKTAWDANAPNATLVEYPNLAPANGVVLPPSTPLSWARITIQNLDGSQGSLSGALGDWAICRLSAFRELEGHSSHFS